MLCALVLDNSVTEIKELTEEQYQSIINHYQAIVDITDIVPQPQVGWQLVGNRLVTNGTSGAMRITKLAIRQRFTPSEMMAMEAAEATVPIIKYLMNNLKVATFVDLNRADTIAGLGVLVSYGFITSDRMNVILTTPPTEVEKYKE